MILKNMKPVCFRTACETVRHGTFAVDEEDRVRLYVLYKVATDAPTPSVPKPWMPWKVPYWNAWNENKLTAVEARHLYVSEVQRLVSNEKND